MSWHVKAIASLLPVPIPALTNTMRASVLRKSLADPWKTHAGDTSKFWGKVRTALVVNPDSSTGNPLPRENRTPEPGYQRPEAGSPRAVPASKASDIAQNQYFNRDYRRAFPKTEFVNQNELATLLIAQGEAFTSLPRIQQGSDSTKALTADSPAPSLASLYSGSSAAVATTSFKPPKPPGLKYEWHVSDTPIEDANKDWFPMELYSSRRTA